MTQPSDAHDPELPGEIVSEWSWSPANAQTGSTGAELSASARIDAATSDADTTVSAHQVGAASSLVLTTFVPGAFEQSGREGSVSSSGGDIASVCSAEIEPVELPFGQTLSRPPSPTALFPDEQANDAIVTSPPPSNMAALHVGLNTTAASAPRYGSPVSLSEGLDENPDERSGEPRPENSPSASTQPPTDARQIAQSTYTAPSSVLSRPANSGIGSPSLGEHEPVHDGGRASTSDTNSQTASNRDSLQSVAVRLVGEGRGVDASHLLEEAAFETSDESARARGEADSMHAPSTATPVRTLGDAGQTSVLEPAPAAVGVAHPDNFPPSRSREVAEHDNPQSAPSLHPSTTPSLKLLAPETRGGRDTVPIDDTDRDLEAGPRIPSPVDECR